MSDIVNEAVCIIVVGGFWSIFNCNITNPYVPSVKLTLFRCTDDDVTESGDGFALAKLIHTGMSAVTSTVVGTLPLKSIDSFW